MTLDLLKTIRISTPAKEGVMQASKWLYLRMLIDPVEFKELLVLLEDVHFLNMARVCIKEDIFVEPSKLASQYDHYISLLKREEIVDDRAYRPHFSLAISKTLLPFYLMQVKTESFLVKLVEPIIRMQLFSFQYIQEQQRFISTYSIENSISWGLEFSFPQFYQDVDTCQPVEILKNKANLNTQLFKSLQKWTREATVPVPFIIDENKEIAPFRLGKKCFEWINLYAGMRKHGLKIVDSHANRSDNNR